MSYVVDISEIVEQTGASLYVDAPYKLEGYVVGEDTYALKEPAAVDATLTNTGEGTIVATGTVTAQVTAQCARCLCEFPLEVRADIEGFYVHPGHEEGVPEEQEIELIGADETIDLAPALHAAIVLETPFAPLHDPECAGICSSCGADLNAGDCGCEETEVDAENPFAKLKTMLEYGPQDGDE